MPLAIPLPLSPVLGGYLKAGKFISIINSALTTGDHDLYTVPTGRAAIAASISVFNNSGVGNIVWFPEIKVSSTYHRAWSNGTINNQSGNTLVCGIPLSAGDILAINTATNNGANACAEIVEFDVSSPLKIARVLGLSTGNNTLYTCPANTTAGMINVVSLLLLGNNSTNTITFIPDNGARTLSLYFVPSGQAVGSGYLFQSGLAPSALTRTTFARSATLSAGDFIVVSIDTGDPTQSMWAYMIEQPN